MALELFERGMIEAVYPVMLGDVNPQTGEYGSFFAGPHPDLSGHKTVVVRQVELKVQEHLDRQCLGSQLLSGMSVETVVSKLLINQGSKHDQPCILIKI